jgi:hypothetical protein
MIGMPLYPGFFPLRWGRVSKTFLPILT